MSTKGYSEQSLREHTAQVWLCMLLFHSLTTPTSSKGYLQILLGPGLILRHLHWLSVLFPPSFTLLSPQVPALIAAPTLQVSLLSHQIVLLPTHAVSSALTRTWFHSLCHNPDRHHKTNPLVPLAFQGCSYIISWLWTSHNKFLVWKPWTR